MSGIAVGRLNRLEYRLIATVGMWYCRKRGTTPSDGLVKAAEVATRPEPSASHLLEAGGYAFRIWCRIMYAFIILLVGYGFAFDELFYSRGNVASDVFLAIVSALLIATIVEITIIKIRLNFLARLGTRDLPKRALPKAYDFWVAVVVAVAATPILLFGVYLPIAHAGR